MDDSQLACLASQLVTVTQSLMYLQALDPCLVHQLVFCFKDFQLPLQPSNLVFCCFFLQVRRNHQAILQEQNSESTEHAYCQMKRSRISLLPNKQLLTRIACKSRLYYLPSLLLLCSLVLACPSGLGCFSPVPASLPLAFSPDGPPAAATQTSPLLTPVLWQSPKDLSGNHNYGDRD